MSKIKNFLKNKKVSKYSSILVVSLFFVIFTNSVFSGPLDNIVGFGWGADLAPGQIERGGLGWLSFNSTNDHDANTPGIQPSQIGYGVNLDQNTGYLTGYAWSSNFGWLKFGGLSGFPSGPGTISDNAKLVTNGTQSVLTGWARFCSPAANPNTCTGWNPNASQGHGGWDGWVSLRGLSISGHQYGVILNGDINNGGEFSSFAWGGGIDASGAYTTGVGWIDFADVIFNPIDEPTVDISVADNILTPGQSAELSWNGFDLVNSDTGCTASGGMTGNGGDGWDGNDFPSPAGSFTTGPLSAGQYTYTIECDGLSGGTATDEVIVTVGVSLQLYAEPVIVYPNQNGEYRTKLTWVADPTNGIASGTCVGSGGAGDWNGPKPNPPSSQEEVLVPSENTHFVITCNTTSGGQVSAYADVTQEQPIENITLLHSQVVCLNGVCTTTLTWNTNYIENNTCDQSVEDLDGNPVFGTGWDSQNQPNTGTQNGVIVFAEDPNQHRYILTCESDITPGLMVADDVLLNNESGASQSALPYYIEN